MSSHNVIANVTEYDSRRTGLPVVIGVLAALSVLPAAAVENTLYSFNSWPPSGIPSTGVNPNGTPLRDSSGALYGAAMLGGQYYNGTIYKLTPPGAGQTQWKLSVLYTFTGGSDGGLPNPGLVMDSSGAIYGTTEGGGDWTNQGVAFKLSPPAAGSTQWTYSVLHYFSYSWAYGLTDGSNPSGGLIMDRNGVLYGTTDLGGSTADPSGIGFGTVFKLTPLDAGRTQWQETVLYRFNGGTDGKNPMFNLALDAAGALYGTTLYGGTGACTDWFNAVIGCGIVFKLKPPAAGQTAWTKTTLHSFNVNDGAIPEGKLLIDGYGSIYGATFQGGSGTCTDSLLTRIGCGVIYKLAPPGFGQTAWTETILHDFAGPEGAFPQGGVIADASGALYGTTSGGGPTSYGVGGFGVAYKLVPPAYGQTRWTETVLYNFDVSTSGSEPLGELVRDSSGRLYGVTYGGGAYYGGTIFQITP